MLCKKCNLPEIICNCFTSKAVQDLCKWRDGEYRRNKFRTGDLGLNHLIDCDDIRAEQIQRWEDEAMEDWFWDADKGW